MYSATDAASAAIDFAKGNVEDGIVNSPPSRDATRLPVCFAITIAGIWIDSYPTTFVLADKGDFTYSSEAAVL
jgi:hypothetical protein